MTQNKFKKIFVGGLPPQASENDMREYFSKYGEVCDVVAMRDKTGNKSRGFGFVVFKEAESVDRCQAERPHHLLGKIVDTKRAMPKEESINPDIHCNSKRIFIGGIRKFFTEDDLKNYFGNFGQIVDCTIKRDNVSGVSRGFAFITFTDRDIVDKVILSKPHSIKHCIVDVKKALSPEELRQLDENQSHNYSDYDLDYSRINRNGSDNEDDNKLKENGSGLLKQSVLNKKFTTKRSQSYPQQDYTNAYSGYIMMAPDITNGINSAPPPATHPAPYGYDAQLPLVWMTVQQCQNGLLLTPIATPDIYNGTNSGPISSFFFPPSFQPSNPLTSAMVSTGYLYSPPVTNATTISTTNDNTANNTTTTSNVNIDTTMNGYSTSNATVSDSETVTSTPVNHVTQSSNSSKLEDMNVLKDALPSVTQECAVNNNNVNHEQSHNSINSEDGEDSNKSEESGQLNSRSSDGV